MPFTVLLTTSHSQLLTFPLFSRADLLFQSFDFRVDALFHGLENGAEIAGKSHEGAFQEFRRDLFLPGVDAEVEVDPLKGEGEHFGGFGVPGVFGLDEGLDVLGDDVLLGVEGHRLEEHPDVFRLGGVVGHGEDGKFGSEGRGVVDLLLFVVLRDGDESEIKVVVPHGRQAVRVAGDEEAAAVFEGPGGHGIGGVDVLVGAGVPSAVGGDVDDVLHLRDGELVLGKAEDRESVRVLGDERDAGAERRWSGCRR